jgi:hypothetical protein
MTGDDYEDLIQRAIAAGWDVSKASLYDEEGIEGWRYTSPDGISEFSIIGDWEGGPVLDDDWADVLRAALASGEDGNG